MRVLHNLRVRPAFSLRAAGTALIASVIAAFGMVSDVAAQPARRIAGATPEPVARGLARDTGRMNPAQMLRLTLTLEPRNGDEFERFLRDVQDPGSPQFHRFLSFDEWKRRFAPLDGDVARVEAWGRGSRLSAIHRFRNNLALKIEGTAAAVENAFGVELHQYQLGARRFFSNDRDPILPPELAGVLKNVQGLNSYYRVEPASHARQASDDGGPIYTPGPFIRQESVQSSGRGHGAAAKPAQTSGALATGSSDDQPSICCGSEGGIEAPDLFTSEAYNLSRVQRFSRCCNPNGAAGGSPKETSIAIIGDFSVAASDIQTFVGEYGMALNLTQVMIDGASCCNDEMTWDVESATAFANNFGASADSAHVYAYEGGGNKLSDTLDAWEQAHSEDRARSASSSFGAYENKYGGLGDPSISDYTDVINAMAAEGWAIAVASGDHGATDDCNHISVHFPASSPNVVAAGGTTLVLDNNGGAAQFASEMAWNGTGCGGTDWPGDNRGGGGGGCADVEPRPTWQESVPICEDKRALPDIALNAGTGQRFYYGNGGGWKFIGGTSIAAPELAGFFAQLNSYLLRLGNICGAAPFNHPCAPYGNPAQIIWQVGAAGSSSNGHNPFYDVTAGCNGGQDSTGFCAGPGYDRATGWGSVNMLQLAWALIDAVTHRVDPSISFTGPAVNTWYNTDKHVEFTVESPSPAGTTASVQPAGYTAQWDSAVADVVSHTTPGSGDSFYTGPLNSTASGFLSLAAAGIACHTAHVRGWDNSGKTTSDSTYGPVCYDNQAPDVLCLDADGLWHSDDVSVRCFASDQVNLSGLANPDDDDFLLVTSVPAGTETADALTNTHQVCDNAGNCATGGPVGGNRVDKKAPSIAIAAPTAAEYIVNQPVTADYACSDGGSGIATCAGPVATGAAIDTASVGAKTFTVNATDHVANASVLSVGYNVTYRICLQYDPNQPMNGRGLNLSLQLCDYSGSNVSQQSIVVKALAVDGQPARATSLGNVNPGNRFLYGPGSAPGASYLYVLDSRGLAAGAHVLTFSVAGDPVTHAAPFILKK